MSLDLTSVRAKLGRAKEHLDILKNDVSKWYDLNPYRPREEINADGTKHSLFVDRTATPPPALERWSLQFGDAVHNLRSVLDHLIYAIAIHQTGSNPPPGERSLAFIIEKSADDFASRRSRMKPNAFTSSVWAAIESFQPYNRAHPILPPLLRILSDLDNSDKHRLPNAVIATAAEVDVRLEGMKNRGVELVGKPQGWYGELKDSTEVLRAIFNAPAPEMHYKVNSIEIVFAVWHGKRNPSDPEWMSRTEATALLIEITKEINEVIDTLVKVA